MNNYINGLIRDGAVESQDLITGIRWELLRVLADQPLSGADLARLTNTSPPNVAQHLKLLELAGFVSRERINGKSLHYRLSQDAALITFLGAGSFRQTVPLDPLAAVELRLFIQQTPASKLVRRFLLSHEELAQQFVAFGIVKEDKDVQLLVLAQDVKALRKDYANINLGGSKIIIWSHTPQEFQEGLSRGEHYFTDMLRNVTILHDPTKLLHTWKEGLS